MLLPIKSQNPSESFPFGTIGLIIVNCAVYVATSNGLFANSEVISKYGLSLSHFSGVTMLSHMFLHADLLQIVGNMWFLYLFGFAVEGRLRTPKFLLLYLVAGMAGGGLHLAFVGRGADLPLIGAGGGIAGILAAALYLFPHSLVQFSYWLVTSWGVTPWRMYWVAVYYLGFDALSTALHRPGIATGAAHVLQLIGGAAAGAVVCLALKVKRDSLDTSDAKAMFSTVKDLRFLSVRELASMAKSNPTDTTITLNWATRSLMDVHGISQDCLDAFMGMLPRIIEKEPAAAVGNALAGLSTKGVHVQSSTMVVLAARIERTGDPRSAASLYDAVIKDLEADPTDQEAAYYRLGMLSETRFANPHQACEYYVEVVRRFPMGSFVDQARIRLTALGYKEPL